jgi:hypothetical protein
VTDLSGPPARDFPCPTQLIPVCGVGTTAGRGLETTSPCPRPPHRSLTSAPAVKMAACVPVPDAPYSMGSMLGPRRAGRLAISSPLPEIPCGPQERRVDS